PGDFTPGCTAQAKGFKENMNRLADKGVEVVGVSGDSVATHILFKKAQMLNFTLLADEDGTLAGKFGVPLGKAAEFKARNAEGQTITIKRNVTAARWTFVVGKDGKILHKNVNVNPVQDSKQIADLIDKLEQK